MAYEPNPGDGALFANKRKEPGDKRPEATGYVIAHRDIKAGEKLNLAAWTKTSGTGKFQSLKMSDPFNAEQTTRDAQRGGSQQPPAELDDEIPFLLWGDLPERRII